MSSENTQQFEFRLPDPGEGLTEAEIIEWDAETGENIHEDDPLVNVETDKAVVEIPAPCTGTLLEIRAEPGEIKQVGDVIAVFETENPPRQQPTETGSETQGNTDIAIDEPSTSRSDASVDTDGSEQKAESADDGKDSNFENEDETSSDDVDRKMAERDVGRVFAPPSTRRYARETGINLREIEGSGPNGRVLREDINQHLESGTSFSKSEPGPEPEDPSVTGSTASSTDEAGSDITPDDQIVRRPLRGLRRTIAENMQQSKQEIPHVTSGFEADARELVALKERLDEKHDVRITYTPILLKAVVPALQEFPLVNASIDMDEGEIIQHNYYNIGVATHTKEGLIVPVIEDVNRKSIVEIATELGEKVDQVRNRNIDPGNLRNGTFTVTNTGSHGGHSTFGTPIIRHPEAAILGIGTIEEQPVAVDGELTVRDQIGFSFSYDHRLIDGVTAAQFVETVIECIEDPDRLLARI